MLVALGGLLLVGLFADKIGRRTRVPRVTLLILFGIAEGQSGLDLLPDEFRLWYEFPPERARRPRPPARFENPHVNACPLFHSFPSDRGLGP